MGGPRYNGVLLAANNRAKNVIECFQAIKTDSVLYLSTGSEGTFVVQGWGSDIWVSYKQFAMRASPFAAGSVVFRGANCEEHFWVYKRGQLVHDGVKDWGSVEETIGSITGGVGLENFLQEERESVAVILPPLLNFVGPPQCNEGEPKTGNILLRQLRSIDKLISVEKLREALDIAETLLKDSGERLSSQFYWKVEYFVNALKTRVLLESTNHDNDP